MPSSGFDDAYRENSGEKRVSLMKHGPAAHALKFAGRSKANWATRVRNAEKPQSTLTGKVIRPNVAFWSKAPF
jgi:hypothetical protein